jgi:hypothetical protein
VPVSWKDVGCASIAAEDLPVLAELRCRREIRVSIVGDRAWIVWEAESEAVQHALVRHILPLPGVELFVERAGSWYRLGEHLPAFDVPAGVGIHGSLLEGILLPKPFTAQRPGDGPRAPLPVRLVHDQRGQTRPASAVRCRLGALWAWAEQATSAQLARVLGAYTEGPGGGEVLVLGAAGVLPPVGGGMRFWGTEVLIPLGFRTDPDLPGPGLRRATEAGPGELVVLDWDGFELIPRDVFQPLCRAGIRLARPGMQLARPGGDRRP